MATTTDMGWKTGHRRHTTPPPPADPVEQLPEETTLTNLKHRLANGEPVTPEQLADATHAAEYARLAHQGQQAREQREAEQARTDRINTLVDQLAGHHAAEQARELLHRLDTATSALADLADLAHQWVNHRTHIFTQLRDQKAITSHTYASDLWIGHVAGRDIAIDRHLPARLVAAALTAGTTHDVLKQVRDRLGNTNREHIIAPLLALADPPAYAAQQAQEREQREQRQRRTTNTTRQPHNQHSADKARF